MSRRDNIRRAREIIASRHAESVDTYKKHTLDARTNIPGFAEIDSEIAETGLKIMACALGKEKNENIDSIHSKYDALVVMKRQLLSNSGYPSDYCDIKYFCEKCSDTGYCGIEICDCLRKEIIKASLETSGLYSLTSNQTFESFSLDYYENNDKIMMERNYSILKSFAENFEPCKSDSFLFIGGTGLGKTHLSSAVSKAVIERGGYVVYESAVMLFADYESKQFGRNVMSTDGGDTEKYLDCDLLIIDDLGCEMTNNFTVTCLYNIINYRMLRHQSTIISTNLTQNELRKRYSDRVLSRILGEYKPLLFSGNDIREQKIRRGIGQK